MEFVRQIVDGADLSNFFDNIPPSLRGKQVEVIVSPVDDSVAKKPNYACNLGFWNGPPLPDSFFDPLPEEDLQAWGL